MARNSQPLDELYAKACDGHRRSLGRLLTIVERGGPQADIVSDLAHADVFGDRTNRAHIVGITGAPGAGKSTLTGQLVSLLVARGKRPAILAVDPSSPLTGGAILGDRIRMEGTREAGGIDKFDAAESEIQQAAFIRSMATRGHSGGLALAVPLAVRLFDAVGYDPVIIETVGVGQVEVDVVGAADTAVVVMTPGMGDAVQANKAGLLEVADLFVVNKADRPGANDVRRDLELMLDLSHLTGQEADDGYRPPIVMASALEGTGSADVWDAVEAHLELLDSTDRRQTRLRHRIRTELEARLTQTLAARIDAIMGSEAGDDVIGKVEDGSLSSATAGAQLLERLVDNR